MSEYPVIHFEMPYDDAARAQGFYQQAFGWNITPYGDEMGNYVVLGTAETDTDGMLTKPGAINGGIYPRMTDRPQPGVCVGCADINTAMESVKAAGGTVHGEPMQIPGVGTYVAFTDTEGNDLSLLQPSR